MAAIVRRVIYAAAPVAGLLEVSLRGLDIIYRLVIMSLNRNLGEGYMNEKKEFEMPEITTYRRDELILDVAYTMPPPTSHFD